MVSVGADGDFEGALDGSDFGFSVEEVSSSSSFSVSSGNPVGDADDRYHARMRKYADGDGDADSDGFGEYSSSL